MAQQIEILSLNIDTNQLLQRLSQTRNEIDQLQASQRQLQQSGQGSSQQFVQQAAQLRNLQGQYRTQLNVVQQLNAANNQTANATDAVNTALNRNITTIAEATENNRQLLAVRNQLNLATQEGQRNLALINQRINENTEFIRTNVSAQEQQRLNIGNYSSALGGAADNLTNLNTNLTNFTQSVTQAGSSGNYLRGLFNQLTTGIMATVRAAAAFIATPIGAAIAAITAAFAAGKAIFDYNKGLQEANKELKALGVNASELSNVRSEITATAETFDKEFTDIAAKANSLAKAYGISMSEANDIIAKGLAAGGAQNSEFLDSLGEYDALFAKAGYSAEQFVNIVNQGYELGIYSDKLPDAIKEADLSLREQTKATRDALVNAFGASFTDEILKSVRTGEKTTAQALDAIAAKSKETSLTQQQQAQLTADVFKGAGEDAGGALEILKAVNQAANKELDETAKKQIELADANERLNKAQASLFEVKGFGDIWTSIKVVAIDALAGMLEYLTELKQDLQPIIDFVGVVLAQAWNNLKTTVSVVFDFIKGYIQVITNTLSTFFNFFKAIVKGDFQGAIDALKNGFSNLLNIVGNTFARIKNTIIDGLKSLIDNVSPVLDALGVDVDKLNKRLDAMKSKVVTVKKETKNVETTTTQNQTVNDVDPQAAEKAKAAADAQKKAAAEQAKATDAIIKKYQEELDLFIASQDFKKKSMQEELALEKQILDKKLALNELEYSKGKKSKEAYEAEKYNLTNSYLKKQADAVVANAQLELDEYKKGIEKKKADDTFYTEEKLKAQVAENNALLEKEIEYQTVRLEQGQINEQEYLDAIDTLKENNRIKNEEAEKEREEAKKEQELIDLENQRILDEEKFQNDFDLQLERENQRYLAELAAAEKTGADTDKIKQKHANIQKNIEKEKEMANLQLTSQALNQAASLFKENTLAYKALAIAQATMNTYMGATKALADYSYPFGAIFAGLTIAQGLVSVGKIAGISFADGGQVPSYSGQLINSGANLSVPLSNGDDTLAYVGQGEVILNREQQARAGGARFFRSIGVPGFAGGGIVGGNTNLARMDEAKIDYDVLAQKIGESVGQANLLLPAPVTVLDEITTAQANQSRIIDGANI